ncbi:protein MODIFYING WALL LIGNIN-1 isoform X1 [Nymphaea colorata]|nr:protein MODIFYING WALL LIGNIN-1 isoform X1 [Nymphaea colorata]
MAVTHADLTPSRRKTDLGSKFGTTLMVVCVLCGLSSFVFCLTAESMKSEVTWVQMALGQGRKVVCLYSGSGRTPFVCSLVSLLLLAIAMGLEHGYLLTAITKTSDSNPGRPPLLVWMSYSSTAKSMKWQALLFFMGTWICFAVGEVILVIGIAVESGHLHGWARARTDCLVMRTGLFAAAGVFGLTAMFIVCALYLTALQAQKLYEIEESVRREILEASNVYASQPQESVAVTVPQDSRSYEADWSMQTCQDHRKPSNST